MDCRTGKVMTKEDADAYLYQYPEERKYFKEVTYHRTVPKTGRNHPCPCGSGRKFKKCCLMVERG